MLNQKESEIMQLLTTVWNAFVELDSSDPQKPFDASDFGRYIRQAQQLLLVRSARREDPNTLLHNITPHNPTEDGDNECR